MRERERCSRKETEWESQWLIERRRKASVCVCVRERQADREGARDREKDIEWGIVDREREWVRARENERKQSNFFFIPHYPVERNVLAKERKREM